MQTIQRRGRKYILKIQEKINSYIKLFKIIIPLILHKNRSVVQFLNKISVTMVRVVQHKTDFSATWSQKDG